MPKTATLQRFNIELRAEVSGNKIVGHASVFGQVADVGAHWEQIERSAFDEVLAADETDVRAFINHDHNLLLGRQSAGTLRVETDSEGLYFEVDLPDTSYARDLRVLAERGDMTGASFGFVPGDDRWERAPDGRRLRSHTNLAGLVDVSPVTFPAYSGAGVALRSIQFGTVTKADEYRRKLVRAKAVRTLQRSK